jgi:uncharacterized protein YdeI (YjbR/CyaY-like superfamily)
MADGSPLETLVVSTVAAWHAWLQKYHLTRDGVWLVFHKPGSAIESISYDDALDEALALGWIDSVIKKLDDHRYARKFTPRRPGSIWSKRNIVSVRRLQKERRMTVWGLEAFEIRTGELSLADKFKAIELRSPEDLEAALRRNKRAWKNFQQFTPSYRKRYLMWISAARNPETRQKRIIEAVALISQNVKSLLK